MADGDEFSGEWTVFLRRLALMAALLAGFAAFAQRPGPIYVWKSPKVGLVMNGTVPPPGWGRTAVERPPADTSASGGPGAASADVKTLRQVIDEVSHGERSPELEKALEEAKARGDLDKTFSDGVTFNQILEEAKQGHAGPEIYKVIAGARARGELDKMTVQGKSLSWYMDQAEAVSKQADEQGRRNTEEMLKAQGIDPAAGDPRADVREMIKMLRAPSEEARLGAAQQLSDLHLAANAESAIPDLERIAAGDPSQEVREFAKLALQRIRYCTGDSLCRQKWRKI